MEHRQGQTDQMATTKRHGAGHDDGERGDDEVGDVRKGDEVPYLELV